MWPKKRIAIIGATITAIAGCQTAPPALPLQVEVKSPPSVTQGNTRIEHMLFFAFNSHALPDNALTILSPHADYLIANPDEVVLVQGAADDVGMEDFNRKLGLKRAAVVIDTLVSLGVSDRQLLIQSAGETKPLNHSSWPESNARNRYVALYY